MKLDNLLDESRAIDANSISTSSTWKERIVTFMTSADEAEHSIVEILEATDPIFDGKNLSKRKKCLESQLTYIRQDLDIHIKRVNDQVTLVGLIRDKKLIPFSNVKM